MRCRLTVYWEQAACGIAMLVGHIEAHPSLKIDAKIITMFRDALECSLKGIAYSTKVAALVLAAT
jgi:hypothetical protein